MAVTNAMFLFEVVVENVKSMVETRFLVIRSDFADIFSLELKDPKQMHITMPEPLPLPPEPPGKKGKKGKKNKPKAKKGKKGKKGKTPKVEEPPPEPAIQSGQSVLFSSSAEILIENMKKCPLEISLWNKEDNLIFIGTTCIPWDPIFILYLEKIANCQDPPPVTLKDEYNIFEEGKAKLMAKIAMQVKLSYLTDKVTTAFRTLSEDPTIRKFLYTGINSKTTSFMCTLKTPDEIFEENCNKIENQFIIDKPKPKPTKVIFAEYKNAPAANLTDFEGDDYCCLNHADKPPDSKYKAPETCPDIDFIIDYVRKIIVSCNDNMRMLTPHPLIRPRVKATDIDRLCYCGETTWPSGEFAERFKKEAQSEPCPLCIDAGKKSTKSRGATFDIANIRGPCGKADCRIARDLRAYIENLVDEDNTEFNLNDLIGPCGSKDCTLTEKILEFLRHEGVFAHEATLEGLSTQCACIEKMRDSLKRRSSCASVCSKSCEDSDSDDNICEGEGCPFKRPDTIVYDVYYFTVEYDFDKRSPSDSDKESAGKSTSNETNTIMSTKSTKSSKYKYCGTDCLSKPSGNISCSKTICSTDAEKNIDDDLADRCQSPICPIKHEFEVSPADSHIEIKMDEIHNPCSVKSCDVANRVKEFIADGVTKKTKCHLEEEEPCFCDCECSFKFSRKTTYCAVCGGYECLGDDIRDQPEFMKPHPCPVYHKLYNKKYIQVKSPWPEEGQEQKKDSVSAKSSKAGSKPEKPSEKRVISARSVRASDKKTEKKEVESDKVKKSKQDKKKVGKFTANVSDERHNSAQTPTEKKADKYAYPAVPRHMGWNWNAEDVPGMKPRPKWRPGAVNKLLVRKYRAVREGVDLLNKKKRALMQRKKKIEMKPTLIVSKRAGEYTVQMEVFKKYSKERLLFQYPYDEKPPLIYTIGKTEEEIRKIQRQRDRRERRETRRKSRLLQSTFRDRCQEICLKAYNQAIGLLPLPNPNDPDCPCSTQPDPSIEPPIVDSCSCSDCGTISSSDTDHDEWIIEFTPPAARWDVKAKHPSVVTDNECQYSYLDFKVKLFDKSGNPVPRFFKGPDGKQECSDLGGFWSPARVWLEINKDGYIGPDNRWVPMNFIGPDGLFCSAEDGSFLDSEGQLLKIGIDGYIDKDGKWAFYNKKKTTRTSRSRSTATGSITEGKKGVKSPVETLTKEKQEAVAGHKGKQTSSASPPPPPPPPPPTAAEKRKSVAPTLIAEPPPPAPVDKNVKSPKNSPVNVPANPEKAKNPVVMNVSVDYNRSRWARASQKEQRAPMNSKKLEKYRDIMGEFNSYDDLDSVKRSTRSGIKTSRASNTPRKKISPFTILDLVSHESKMRYSPGTSLGRTSITSSPDSMAKSNNSRY